MPISSSIEALLLERIADDDRGQRAVGLVWCGSRTEGDDSPGTRVGTANAGRTSGNYGNHAIWRHTDSRLPGPGATHHGRLFGEAATDEALAAVGKLGKVNSVDLSGVTFSSTGLSNLVEVRNLTTLELRGTTIGNEGLQSLGS